MNTKRYCHIHLPGANFINFVCMPFSYESALGSFSLIIVWIHIFLAKEYRSKAARKMLMKLTTNGFTLLQNEMK